MASRSTIRPRPSRDEPDRGRWNEARAAWWTWPSNRVGGSDPAETGVRGLGGDPAPEPRGVDSREKPAGECGRCPYRKPTQVGEASSLR